MKKSNTIRRCEIVTNLEKEGQPLFDLDNMNKVLSERTCIAQYCYIIHDRDVYTETDEKHNPDHKAGQLKAAHIHLLLRFNQPQHIPNIAKWFGIPENFVQKIHGKWEDACAYQIHANAPDKYQYPPEAVICNFDFQRILEKKDAKTELDKILQRILDGEIREYNRTQEIDNFLLVHCAYKIEQAFKVRQERLEVTQQERNMMCIFITGKSGVGKTTLAKQIAKSHGYSYFVSSGSNDIMDGYRQQDCLILDDIRPSCLGLSDLLKMLDPHTASSVKSRYKNKYLNCQLVILTSVLDLNTFYKNVFTEQEEPITQLKRRCKLYIKMYQDEILVYRWDERALDYIGPIRNENNLLDNLLPERKQTLEDTRKSVKEWLPFLEPVEDEVIETDTFHLERVYPESELAEGEAAGQADSTTEVITDKEFQRLLHQAEDEISSEKQQEEN